MTPKNVKKEIERLREELERHNRLYYLDAAPEISDHEFDQLLRKLQQLEAAIGQLETMARTDELTSLGLGALQISSGLEFVWDVESTTGLGHRALLRDPAVIGRAVAFLREGHQA